MRPQPLPCRGHGAFNLCGLFGCFWVGFHFKWLSAVSTCLIVVLGFWVLLGTTYTRTPRPRCMDADPPRHRGIRSGAAAKRRRTAYARNIAEEIGVPIAGAPIIHTGGQSRPLYTLRIWDNEGSESDQGTAEGSGPAVGLPKARPLSVVTAEVARESVEWRALRVLKGEGHWQHLDLQTLFIRVLLPCQPALRSRHLQLRLSHSGLHHHLFRRHRGPLHQLRLLRVRRQHR